jgi:hypothetical protein
MTYDDIVSVLGHIDDDLAATLVATGTSVDELYESWNWLHNDKALMREGRPLPGTRDGQLIDLLIPEDDGVD